MAEAAWHMVIGGQPFMQDDADSRHVIATGAAAEDANGPSNFDVQQVLRFALIGALTAGLYFVLSGVFQDGLGWDLMWASAASFTLSVVFQYAGHGLFTFRRRLRSGAQIIRFIVTVGIGFALSVVVVGLGEQWQLPRDATLLAVMILATIVNWLIFRWWVFIAQETDIAGGRNQ